jgi:enoyl-[acyl-carrier protein] reductase III
VALGLDGRTALVTGGGRGVGRAIVDKLAACGCRVHAMRLGPAEEAGMHRGDVADPAVLRDVVADHGPFDIFVHNAAAPLRPTAPLDTDPSVLEADLRLALGPLLTVAPGMVKTDGGRIIAVSSSGAGRVVPGYAARGVAKAALESLVRYLAADLAPHGVTVNAVSTSKIDKGVGGGRLAARTPAGRLTTPRDVADVVALLCTPEAGFIQGQVVTVDGGLGLLP